MRTAQIRAEVELDEFVIMPNHFHAIVILTAPWNVICRGARRAPSAAHRQDPKGARRAPLRRSPRTLGSLMAGFKSACTRRINHFLGNAGSPVWQRSHYEHVIRKDEELDWVRQ